VTVSVWLPDLFVICGGNLMEISDLSGERSQVRVLRLSLFFRSFTVLGTGGVGNPRDGVVSFLVGNVDIGVFF
jgi:hypothetical protein